MGFNYLILAGALLLGASLIPAFSILRKLSQGKTKTWWILLVFLVLLFIGGYLLYFFEQSFLSEKVGKIITPAVFFGGGAFVLIILLLSLQAIKAVQHISVLEQENITDPLMGIYNRRYFDRKLHEEFLAAKRYSFPLSLILIDIDKFKQINDTYGHCTGDAILQGIGQILRTHTRDVDIPARYGGDEIAIITTNTSAEDALKLANRLKERIASEQFSCTDPEKQCYDPLSCSVSIGVAELSSDINSPEEFFDAADRKMYESKQNQP